MVKNDRAKLSSKQRQAIRSLLSKPSIASAAKASAVSETTLYRWLREPAFRQELTEAESVAIDTAARRLVGLTEAAISVIVSILADMSIHPSIRLRAATVVIENMLIKKANKLRTIAEVAFFNVTGAALENTASSFVRL